MKLTRFAAGRKKALVALVATLLLSLVTTVDATFAQGGFHRDLVVPDVATVDPSNPTLSLNPDQSQATQTSASLTTVVAVNARVMSLVSLAARQVQMAKSGVGAQEVAREIIAITYPKWNASQVSCLNQLWNAESHWNYKSHNRRSGAHGIAQALPASKMDATGTDWLTNPVTQIKWGLNYVSQRYGTPCKALAHHHRVNSY
jgi:hypothetical protein